MSPTRPARRETLGLLVILALALVLRLWGLSYGIADHFVRPDEPQRVGVGLQICRPSCHPGGFNIPSALYYLLAALLVPLRFATGGEISLDAAIMVGRAANLAASLATILVTFRLARDVVSGPSALWAAAILAVAPLHVREGHFVTGDTFAAFFTVLALYAIAADRMTGAATAIGLAAGFKYPCALLLGSAAVAARRRIVVVVVVAAVVFLATSPYVLLDPAGFMRDFRLLAQIARQGQWSEFGLTHLFPVHRGWLHHARVVLPIGLGVVALGLAGLGLVRAAGRPALWPVAVFTLLFYAVLGGARSVFARYTLPLLPALAVLAAAGMAWIAGQVPPRARGAVALALGLALVWEGVIPSARMDHLLSRRDSRALLTEWLDQEAPGEPIAITGMPPWALPAFRGRAVSRLEGNLGGDPRLHLDALRARGVRRVVILEHPLAYARNNPELLGWLREHATPAFSVEAHQQVTLRAFDPLDAFFVPWAEFERVVRPGPNVTVYRLPEPAE